MRFFKTANIFLSLFCALAVGASGCAQLDELKKPETASFYGAAKPPQTNEFRWANGDAPKNLDPIFAAAPAEMQIVRAAFDGLTAWDAKTLKAVPAIAQSWEASDDARTHTFHLRPNAVWSNNRRIVAKDFVRAWRRLLEKDAKDNHRALLENVVGARQIIENAKESEKAETAQTLVTPAPQTENPNAQTTAAAPQPNGENAAAKPEQSTDNGQRTTDNGQRTTDDFWFGVEAVNDQTLRVYLSEPDKDFAQVAAHSALRPIYGDGGEFEKPDAIAKITVSGAFKFVENAKSGLLLERDPNYWNADAVTLEKVRFVPMKNAENALAAYRAGEVDAVTNVQFEPLALKLLQSYKDFVRTKFNAVNVYEFNLARPPFDDARVRRALTIAIDRERLANDELDGASFAAATFLPDSTVEPLKFDAAAARNLLAEAGFGAGKNFPKIRLLINRNDAQRRVARAVAAQWRKNLNVETEIVTSSSSDLSDAAATEDFDLTRRTIVLPTPAATASLRRIFKSQPSVSAVQNPVEQAQTQNQTNQNPQNENLALPAPSVSVDSAAPTSADASNEIAAAPTTSPSNAEQIESGANPNEQNGEPAQNDFAILTDEQAALEQLTAIPLYFPMSYALVKPYVAGFDANALDAPQLQYVRIESDWQPAPPQ